ncbi:MAG TPA: hypothetical protein VHZ49_00495 [Methylomirabilota bacterium]|nr:hypothetical protein [Methylomirabilota bacterium]
MIRRASAVVLLLAALSAAPAAFAAAARPSSAPAAPPIVEVVGGPRPESLDRLVDIMHELGLSLPSTTRVYIYSSRQAFRRGIVEDANLSPDGADELAAFAVGLARPGRILVNGRLADAGSEWIRLLAHELTHVAQFQLAGGEGRADQWLAEGMAEHVAFQVLERMGLNSLERQRRVALRRARGQAAVAQSRLDLATLGSPRQFTLRHQREGSTATYHLTFLLADYLIERHGFPKVVQYFARLRGRSSAAAFAATFGQTLEAFEREVLPHLKRAMADPEPVPPLP